MHDKIGRHISVSGSIDLTLDLAKETSCNSMQIFVSSPMQWKVRELKEEELSSFIHKKKELDVAPVVVHMPYLPNLASPNPEIYPKSVETLRLNMERCNQLGAEYLVIHLGSTMGRPKSEAMNAIADGINSTIDIFDGMLLLENQAGQKNTVGSDLGDLADLWDSISHRKVGYCIDTCHAFGAGYDIRKSEAIDQIDRILGWEKVHIIHANDSKFDLGEHKDRHENIGKGFIGEKGFRTFLGHAKIRGKPIIMETPTDKQAMERREIELVRSLIG
ncbi:MAG: deoxyribonuclease IV [Candidatus Micrarchaeota archaeon]|nr:deoxyribonuclease IV [Candidatus Micrarchaeota archaeon]MDE1848043.1 deoxyribonuclease IV [Candidatus Micrarchaeota archaeon]MDE1864726.1 deoxyribonuclease IV [Candidatus Micrarchaeota archaeon]